MHTPANIVTFWHEAGPSRWFATDENFDREIAQRFGDLHHAAARRELDTWTDTPEGALALILLLDQFPRNMFRGSAHSYATDGLARLFAERAIASGHDGAVDAALRVFFYMPFEHSEDAADQEQAVRLITALDDAEALDWALKHREAIARFGRFPGRNHALGRITTAEEQAWLDEGGGGFSG